MEVAAHLHGLGCRVRVALPEPDGGADIADWLAVGKAHAKAKLAGLLRDYEPQPEPQPEQQPEDEPGISGRDRLECPTTGSWAWLAMPSPSESAPAACSRGRAKA